MMKRYVKFAKSLNIKLTLLFALIFTMVTVLQYSYAANCAGNASKVQCSCGGCTLMICPEAACGACTTTICTAQGCGKCKPTHCSLNVHNKLCGTCVNTFAHCGKEGDVHEGEEYDCGECGSCNVRSTCCQHYCPGECAQHPGNHIDSCEGDNSCAVCERCSCVCN